MSSYQICSPEYKRAPTPPAYRSGESTGPIAGTSYIPPPIEASGEGPAWRERAGALADWALASVIVRTDAYVGYLRVPTAEGVGVDPRTIHADLTREQLIRHFGGDAYDVRMAVHVVSPFAEMCKLTIVDIDAHGPEDDPGANWAFAMVVAQRAIERGVVTRVFDSDGAGGFHVWAFHPRPIPCAESYRFGKWLVRGWAEHGLRREPESMPKGPELTGMGFGHTIRLPGRHHKHPHWTAVWDGITVDRIAGFRRGAAAVEAILETRSQPDRDSPSPLVPPDFILPTETYSPEIRGRDLDPEDLDREAARAREALRHLGPDYYEPYDKWLDVGMALRELGDPGLLLWHEWSAQSRSRYRPSDLDQKWQTFAPPAGGSLAWPGRRPRRISLATLFAYAKQEGWTPPRRTAESMAEEADLCRQALLAYPEMLAELASRLEVREEVLHRLGVGWKQDNVRPGRDGDWVEDGEAWTFPLLDGSGAVTGILRRYLDEMIDDRMIRGSKPGLVVPAGWEAGRRPILITESVGDVAWLVGAGYCAIGRPAFTGGVEHLARLLEGVDRKVVVIAEDDRTIDGQWPGKERAEAVAQGLATSLGRGVKRWLPPEGCEGVCEYIKLHRNGSLEA